MLNPVPSAKFSKIVQAIEYMSRDGMDKTASVEGASSRFKVASSFLNTIKSYENGEFTEKVAVDSAIEAGKYLVAAVDLDADMDIYQESFNKIATIALINSQIKREILHCGPTKEAEYAGINRDNIEHCYAVLDDLVKVAYGGKDAPIHDVQKAVSDTANKIQDGIGDAGARMGRGWDKMKGMFGDNAKTSITSGLKNLKKGF